MNDIFKSREDFKKAWIEYTAKASGINDLDYLSSVFDNNFKNNNVTMYNSAKGISKKIDSLLLLDTINKKYIVTESGTFFINHDIYTSPVVFTYDTLKKSRAKNKKMMRKAQENNNTIEEIYYNIAQNDDKTTQNTFYGTQLNIYSKYYNYDVAGSITIRGRSTVSTCGLTIESCFGRYRPYSVEAQIHFINECIKKDITKYEELLKVPSTDEILAHMLRKYYDGYYKLDILKNIIDKLSDVDKKKVYYANNFKEFLNITKVKDLINKIITYSNDNIHRTKDLEPKEYYKYFFINPENPPEGIKDYMKEYADMADVLLTGYYWFEGDTTPEGTFLSSQEIFKNIQRDLILITDTDSLIVYLYGCIKPMIDNLYVDYSNLDEDSLSYILSSLVIKNIELLNKSVLDKYTTQTLIPERYRQVINYKQEFVYKMLQLTKSAKNYLGTIKIQEGVFFDKERIDIKGLSLKKSNFNKRLSDIAKVLSIENVLKEKNPDINKVLNFIKEKRKEIYDLYKSTKNIELFTVNKIKKPYGEMEESDYRMKAVRLYNRLYNTTISLPGSFLVTNVNFNDRIDDLMEKYPDKYELLLKESLERTIMSNKKSIINKIMKMTNLHKNLEFNEQNTSIYYHKNHEGDDDIDEYTANAIKNINKFINEDMYNVSSVEELKELIKDVKKQDNFNFILKDYSFKTVDIKNIEKIAIPLDSEVVDEFITEFIDSNDMAVFENLSAVVVQGIGLEVVRNKKKKQLLTNVVSYY